MILKTQKGSELPDGIITLSKEEALKHQWAFIRNWPSELEVLSIKFGRHIVSGTTLFSSVYILNFFRKVLNINKTRFLVALTPGVIVPTLISHLVADSLITNSTLLMNLSCPLCNQLKFAGCQFYLGLVFPAFYGYFNLANFAYITNSYPVPNIKTHGREFWKMSLKIFKQGTPHFQMVGLVQTILILFLPYLQNKQLCNAMTKSEINEFKDLSREQHSGF